MRWGRFACPAALCAIWAAMVVAVDPVGDFPLNDDWAWGLAAKTLYERHVLTMPGWADASVVAQIVWGALACVPRGFSFTALRLATGAWGLVAVLATYGLSRAAGATRGLAFLSAFAVAANPLLFESANTFMTDTPFMALLLVAMLCAVRFVRNGSVTTAAGFVLAVVAATMTRQVGAVVPVLFAAACLLARTLTVRRVALAAVAALLAYGCLRVFDGWLEATGQLSGNYARSMRVVLDRLRHPSAPTPGYGLGDGLRIVLTYVGFFLGPVLVPIILRWRAVAKPAVALGGALAGWFIWSTSADFARRGWLMPFNPAFNLVDLGVGPITLSDVHVRRLDHWPRAGMQFWRPVTTIGVVGGGVVLFVAVVAALELFRRRTAATQRLTAAMALGFVAAYGVVLVIAPFDRYFMPVFPTLLVAAVCGTDAARSWPGRALTGLASTIAGIALVLQAAFAVAATHDYLAWNRVRWAALNELLTVDGVTPAEIDGGFEFNGFYRYGLPSAPDKGPWVADDRYMVTFGPVPGYRVLRARPYPRWVPPREGAVLVLVRDGAPP